MAIEPKLMSDVSLASADDLARKGATDVEGIYTDPRFYAEMALRLLAHVAAQATELQQLRAAKAVDRERVRDAVLEAFKATCNDQWWRRVPAPYSDPDVTNAIATRVADALSVPSRPSLDSVRAITYKAIASRITSLTTAAGLPGHVWSELCQIDSALRNAIRTDAKPRPIPPLVREIVQREFERVPAGEQHDWERERLKDALEVLP